MTAKSTFQKPDVRAEVTTVVSLTQRHLSLVGRALAGEALKGQDALEARMLGLHLAEAAAQATAQASEVRYGAVQRAREALQAVIVEDVHPEPGGGRD